MNSVDSMSIYTLFCSGMVDVNFYLNLSLFCHKVTFWVLTEFFLFVRAFEFVPLRIDRAEHKTVTDYSFKLKVASVNQVWLHSSLLLIE